MDVRLTYDVRPALYRTVMMVMMMMMRLQRRKSGFGGVR